MKLTASLLSQCVRRGRYQAVFQVLMDAQQRLCALCAYKAHILIPVL